jgi:hypothetical protein
MSAAQALNTAVPRQVGVTSGGVERPITAMITQANNIKSANQNLSVYVIGMSNAPQNSMDRIASDPSMYFPATIPNVADIIRTQINAQVQGCTPAGGYQWIDRVDAAHLPNTAVFPDLSDTVVGYTYIYEPGGGVPLFAVPIQRDLSTDKISLLIPPPDANNPGIAPGTYEMAAYTGYKGNDGVSRMYDWFIDPNTLTGSARVAFTITVALEPGQTLPLDPLFLDLRPTVRICP